MCDFTYITSVVDGHKFYTIMPNTEDAEAIYCQIANTRLPLGDVPACPILQVEDDPLLADIVDLVLIGHFVVLICVVDNPFLSHVMRGVKKIKRISCCFL